VGYHSYNNLPFSCVVSELARSRPWHLRRFSAQPPKHEVHPNPSVPLATADVIEQMRRLDQSKYSFIADVGDSWFIGLELRTDIFLAPGYYATMGFAVPGALGAGIAQPARRPFIIVGDGAFQMTGCELATIAAQKIKAIVLLLNNSSYMMLESLDQSRPYYALKSWDYAGFARTLGCSAERVTSREQLNAALDRAQSSECPYLIEAVISKDDPSPVMRRIRDYMLKTRANSSLPARDSQLPGSTSPNVQQGLQPCTVLDTL
jgi:indolepyruvate decarboxylase